MRRILEDLYHGNLTANGRSFQRGTKYARALARVAETEDALSQKLAPEDHAVGRVTQFAYNANGLISSIRIPAAENNAYRDVFYTYDSANRLTGVRYSELGGTMPHTTYAYEGSTKLLTLARNFDGVQVNVGYESTSLYGTSATDDARRVLSVETVATDASGAVVKSGAKQIFEYGAMTTEVTAVEGTASNAGKKMYYQFNDSGNVICVRDELGFAKFTKYASTIGRI